MTRYWKYIVFVSLMLLMVLWISGFFRPKIESGQIKPPLRVVSGLKFCDVKRVETVEEPYVGVVEPSERAEIATPLSGRVTVIDVKEGDCVEKGASLLKIEGEEIEANIRAADFQIKEAEAEYRRALSRYQVAKVTYERYARLLREQAVTPQEFDEIKGDFNASREALERARAAVQRAKSQKEAVTANLKYTYLTSPFSGCIAEKYVNLGDLATPGKPLLVVEKRPFLFRVELPEVFFEEIKMGGTFKVLISGLDRPVTGKVIEKSSSVDAKTRTFRAKLLLGTGKGVKSGTLGWILIPEKREVLLIPEGAIIKRYDFTGVFVLRPDKILELRWVKLGRSMEGMVEILSGVEKGEKVVVEGIEKACDGCSVE